MHKILEKKFSFVRVLKVTERKEQAVSVSQRLKSK